MITTTYLGMPDESCLRRPRGYGSGKRHVHLEKPAAHADCSFMYSAVGKAYYWDLYRIGWTDLDWSRYFRQPDIDISFICNTDGERIGYLELRLHADGSVEIVNFGLLPECTGLGYGREAIALAVGRGFELGPSGPSSVSGIWLHTCSLDHPRALQTYYSCGFRFLSEQVTDYLPLDMPPVAEGPALACLSDGADAASATG